MVDTSPAAIIARLDASLARRGEDVVLVRMTPGPDNSQVPFSAAIRAHVRGFTADELMAGFRQQDAKVICSPTGIDRTGWPGPEILGPGDLPATVDRRVPVNGDLAIVAGVTRRIEAATGIRVRGELVRIEMTVLG